MKILFCDMGCFTYEDIKTEFVRRGFEVDTFYYHFANKFEDVFYSERIDLQLKRVKYDFCFSVNFLPLVSVACNEAGVKYVSWSYDSPMEERLTEYFHFDTNLILLFDRTQTEKLRKQGYLNVYHLPLAANTARVDKIFFDKKTKEKFGNDVSFVGGLYNSSLDTLMAFADDYSKGYVEGLFQTQFGLYGVNILDGAVSEEFAKSINYKLTKRGLVFAINSKITNIERTVLLDTMAEQYDVSYFGYDGDILSDKVNKSGPVKYFSTMNAVFRYSKLNLCPTLRSIESGIPLRAIDIMAAGGALFSNYQQELAECFTDGHDVIMYSSLEEALEKARYYLKNESARQKIALKGYERVKAEFTYSERIGTILELMQSENYCC